MSILKHRFVILIFCVFFSANIIVVAQSKKTATAEKTENKEIPLIPRELFFDNPEVSGGQISPDGKRIAFLKANNGIMNIWVKRISDPFLMAVPITNSSEPISSYFWSYDGKYILFVEAKGGNENYNVYAVNPLDKPNNATGVPEARNLTPNDKVRAMIFNVSKKNPDVLWVGLNDRDARWHDLYKLEISTGKLTLLETNNDRLSSWVFDWDENVKMATRNPEDGSTELLRKNVDGTYTKIYSCGCLETCAPVAFTKDNSKLYMETNKGDNDLIKLVTIDPKTGNLEDVEKDPLNKVDFGDLQISDKTHDIIYTSYTDAKTRLYFKDKVFESDYKFLQSKFKDMEIFFRNSNRDETIFLIGVYSDNKVPEVFLFDRTTKKLTFQYNPRPKLKKFEKYFGTMDPIVYKSSDGLEIPGYLSLPKGVPATNLPLLVFPHGGPWARDEWGFSAFCQWFTNRGYAVLQMNFRSSTGFGKKFLNAGNKQWGMLMQDDITWGVKYLVDKGIADPKRVGIIGGSYGGYATLAGLAFTPEVYAAGVDIVGPSNLITLLNSIPAYWEAGRKQFTERMGDPSTPDGKALLEKQSPLNSASKIIAPLMIIQGANDPRVKKAESDQIAIALRDLHRQVEYLCAPDEGHGYQKPINNLAAMGRAEVFLGKALHARYQEAMQPEIEKRLKEITVDVAKLSLPKKMEVTPLKEFPAPLSDFAAGTFNYDILFEMQGQKMAMKLTRTIKEENNNWVVLDFTTTPQGNQSDEATYTKGSLRLVSRKSNGGPSDIIFTYESNKFTMSMGGKSNVTNIEGAYIHDGGGNDMVIGRLPLKEGYEAAFNVADQEGKVSLNVLKVTGKETINGTDCFKCEMASTENPSDITYYYFGSRDRLLYKQIASVPGMPGAKLTLELKK